MVFASSCNHAQKSVKSEKNQYSQYLCVYQDVFQLCESKPTPLPGAEGLKQMAKSREETIRIYKEQKELENRLKVNSCHGFSRKH